MVYGRKTADIAGFDWRHVPINSEQLMTNILCNGLDIAALTSPVHLHCMDWFKNVPSNSIVFAGSYGDSIGRAEFSGKHILELDNLKPVNIFGLMQKKVLGNALAGINQDIFELHQRCQNQPSYGIWECEMQGHYMRNLIAQAMSIIGMNCNLYQIFTHPSVYSFMWSVHPALRDDRVYMHLLKQLDPKLLELPWARTNRSLSGPTVGAQSGLLKKFHRYQDWLSGPILSELNSYVDPEWFEATGIFDPESVKKVCDYIQQGTETYGFRPYERWAWLASFRSMAESLEKMDHPGRFEMASSDSVVELTTLPPSQCSVFRKTFRHVSCLYRIAKTCWTPVKTMRKKIRRRGLKRRAIRNYPPNKNIATESKSGGFHQC